MSNLRGISRHEFVDEARSLFESLAHAAARGASVLGNVVRSAAATQGIIDSFVVVGETVGLGQSSSR